MSATPGVSVPRVSVLMPAYNAAPYIDEAVQSVLDQTFADLELIVLDDGSTDDTLGVLRGFDDPRLRIERRPHRGLAPVRNELLELARGELVAVMDADDVALPLRLEHQIAYLDTHPEVGVVGGWLEWFGLESRIGELPEDDADIRRLLRTGTAVADGAMTARRETMRATGGYDDGALWVDWDMDLRLAAVTRLHNLPEVVIRYRRHGSSLQDAVPVSERRREKFRRRLQAVRVLGWRPKSVIQVSTPLLSAWLHGLRERRVEPMPPVRTFAVIVPTVGRPALLRRCLTGIAAQTRAPDETIVVVRQDDAPSLALGATWASGGHGRRIVTVDEPGQVPALDAGLSAARSDVVAFLDDDSVPDPAWLAGLAAGYGPFIGGVGGRVIDVRDGRAVEGSARRVGRVTALGRVIGRMHLDASAQDVAWLTGGNSSYRRALVRVERRLHRGRFGVEFANDVSMGLSVSRGGARLRFEPAARVTHESASPREAGSGLRTAGDQDVRAAAHNLLVGVLSGRRGPSRWIAAAFWFVIGSATAPGPVRALVGLVLGDTGPARRLRAAAAGKREALGTLREPAAQAVVERVLEAVA